MKAPVQPPDYAMCPRVREPVPKAFCILIRFDVGDRSSGDHGPFGRAS